MRKDLFRVRWYDALLIVVIGLAQGALLIWFTLLMRSVVHGLTPTEVGAEAERLYRASLINVGWMAAAAVGLGVLRILEFGFAERAGYAVVRRLRMAMYEHLQGMTPEELRGRARGGLLLRLTGDLSMLRMWLSRGVLLGTVAVLNLVVGIAVISVASPRMGLAVVFALALTASISLTQGRPMRHATRQMRRHRSTLIGNIDEQISGIVTVQVAGRTRGERERLSRQNDTLTRSLVRVGWLRGVLRGIAYSGSLLITVLVLAIGLVELHAHQTTVPDVVTALVIVRFLSRPMRVLGLAHDYWQRGRVSTQKCQEFLTSRSRGFDHPELPALRVRRGVIEFDQVTSGNLRHFTASTNRGDRVLLTGPDGCGQADLLRVVARLQEVQQGQILIDGQPLLQSDERSVLRHVGIVSPEVPLLRGTMRRTLTYNARDAEPTEVQRIVYSLGLQHLWERSGHSLGSWLLEGGSNLTRGERQLVTIARALVGNPPILLLDDPMAGLDAPSQERVRQTLAHYQGTIFQISHDPRDVLDADQVWDFALDGSMTVWDRAQADEARALARPIQGVTR